MHDLHERLPQRRHATADGGKQEAHTARRREVHQRELRGLYGQLGLRRVFRALSDESRGPGAVSESGEQAAQDPGGEAGILHRLRRMRTRMPDETLQSDLCGRQPGAQARPKTCGKENRREA